MQSRGLTLFELLIALALILALGAISMPVMLNALAQREFENAGEVAVQQLLMARAHAQRTGRPVEVIYNHDAQRITARVLNLDGQTSSNGLREGSDRSFDETDQRTGQSESNAGSTSSESSDAFGALASSSDVYSEYAESITEAWAERTLPGGGAIRLTAQQPSETPASAAGFSPQRRTTRIAAQPTSPEATPFAADRAEMEKTIRLAIYLPDGSTLLSQPVWFIDDAQRTAKLTVNPWTGEPTVKRVQRERIADSDSPFADEREPDADEQPSFDDGAPSDNEVLSDTPAQDNDEHAPATEHTDEGESSAEPESEESEHENMGSENESSEDEPSSDNADEQDEQEDES